MDADQPDPEVDAYSLIKRGRTIEYLADRFESKMVKQKGEFI